MSLEQVRLKASEDGWAGPIANMSIVEHADSYAQTTLTEDDLKHLKNMIDETLKEMDRMSDD